MPKRDLAVIVIVVVVVAVTAFLYLDTTISTILELNPPRSAI